MLLISHMPLGPWYDSFPGFGFNGSLVFLHSFTNVYVSLNNMLFSFAFFFTSYKWSQIVFVFLWFICMLGILFLEIHVCIYLTYCGSLIFTLYSGPWPEYIILHQHITFWSWWTFSLFLVWQKDPFSIFPHRLSIIYTTL